MRFQGILLLGLIFCLSGCYWKNVKDNHQIASGAYFFEKGYYKRALHDLLPPAVDGNPRAQYAVGYMYYYGYGVPQDTDVGYFWIEKAARNGDRRAQEALALIAVERTYVPITYSRYIK